MKNIIYNKIFIFALLTILALCISSAYFNDINVLFSFDHYTIQEYFLLNNKDPNFDQHFNYGINAYENSFISTYYKFLSLVTLNKIDFFKLQQISIFIEIIFYFFSIYYFQNKVLGTSKSNNAISSLLITFSSVLIYNFANLKLPHYFGIHYQFSLSFALLSIAAAIYRENIKCAIFNILSLGFHFIIGFYCLIFLLVFLTLLKNKLNIFKYMITLSVFCIPFLYFYGYFEIIDYQGYKYNQIKIFFLKYYSNHHNPLKYPMFTNLLNNYLISKISIALYLFIKIKEGVFTKNIKKIIYACLACFLISFIGLIFNQVSNFEVLKFRIHGIDLIFLLISSIILINILLKETCNNKIISNLNVINISLLGYFNFIFLFLLSKYINKNLKLFTFFIFNFLLILKLFDYVTNTFFLISVFSLLIINFLKYQWVNKLLSYLIFILPFFWIINIYPNNVNLNKEIIKYQHNIIQAAKWINSNTKKDSLILIDKNINPKGGITPYTHRSEYGLPSMLLFDAVIYGNKPKLIEKGIERFCNLTNSKIKCLNIINNEIDENNFKALEKEFFNNFIFFDNKKLKNAGIDYVITANEYKDVESIFKNDDVFVYKVISN